jgi:hypothetical protein
VHLGRTSIDGLTVHAVLNGDGTTNVTSLMGRLAPYSGVQAQTTTAVKPATPTDLSLQAFELSDSTLHITDHRGARPVALELQGVHLELNNLRTTGQTPASFVIGAHPSGGGSAALKGRLDLAQSQITSDVSLDQIDLPTLQDFAPSVLAGEVHGGSTERASQRPDLVRRRPVQRACGACDRVARPGRVAPPWPTGNADCLDPPERIDRTG